MPMEQGLVYWRTIECIAKVRQLSMGQAQEYFETLPEEFQEILAGIAMLPDEEALQG